MPVWGIRKMATLKVASLESDEAIECFYQKFRDPRLDTVKPDASVPKVGDIVRLNDCGLEQCFGHANDLAHMKTLEMRVTQVDATSVTYPEPTFCLEVDNEAINQHLLDHHCFDIVRRIS